MTPEELQEIEDFALEKHTTKHVPEMEAAQETATGYEYRVGEIVNEAEHAYNLKCFAVMQELKGREDETETSKQATLKAKTAGEKKTWADMKLLHTALRNVRMTLAQAIKTRREER